ncbi:MAG TPA: NADH-quinone oxidoreductase subunit D [Coriobacteriia bacterium]|jgi:NADH-quinone oxidoreductase subunit D
MIADHPRVGHVTTGGTTESIVLNMGPQHPSMHGVMHMQLELSGETVLAARPVIGYLHRGIEKLAEHRTYAQCMVLVDRLDYISQYSNEWAYCRAVEKLAAIEVAERAEWLRTLYAELVRITSHLLWWTSVGLDLGAFTPMIYAMLPRERIFDFFEATTGSRLMPNYLRFGGVKEDVEQAELDGIHDYLAVDYMKLLDDYDTLLSGNEIFISRQEGLARITTEQAVSWGVTGPMLRATGCPRDLRKDARYGVYDQLDWETQTDTRGDALARYTVRVKEMRESARIAMQCIERMPAGEVRTKVAKILKPPEGEVYVRHESTRGELGIYIVSDGTAKPYRFRVHSPAFMNVSALPHMLPGEHIANFFAIFGGADNVMAEIDR